SHTMLAVFIMSTAAMQILRRVNLKWLKIALVILSLAILLIVVIGRLLSGVHWFTDILAGALLSGALAAFYYAVCKRFLWID
ncbi:MAG: phosphatase PAP2 family protein, partial [Clostridia bacterium]|nr:phosphatase PAP2 family protein [Clostridia bacterium]